MQICMPLQSISLRQYTTNTLTASFKVSANSPAEFEYISPPSLQNDVVQILKASAVMSVPSTTFVNAQTRRHGDFRVLDQGGVYGQGEI